MSYAGESMPIKCVNNRGLDQPTHRCSRITALYFAACVAFKGLPFIALSLR